VGYEPGDIFLLCTDGLVEGLYNDHLVELLRTPGATAESNPAKRLVTESVAKDGRDNTTALVIQVS
jgi:protein phosphatase